MPKRKSVGISAGSTCAICADKASGRHYKVITCDGCKGFFRRSIRNNTSYTCRFQKQCVVSKNKRIQCKHCRLAKCINMGMRKDAVQNERDKIRVKQNRKDQSTDDEEDLSIASLRRAELDCATFNYRLPENLDNKLTASINDVCESMKQQLLNLVDWAKRIKAFNDLLLDDQVALLRAHAGEHLVLGVSRRSMHLDGVLLLGNNCILAKQVPDAPRFFTRVFNELIREMKDLALDDVELACIRALVFFDPNAKRLTEPHRVTSIRRSILINLEDYVADKQEHKSRGRVGEILLILPLLQSIALQLIEQIQLAKLFGAVHLDNLLQEMLLGENSMPLTSNETLSGGAQEKDDFMDTILEEISSWAMELNLLTPTGTQIGDSCVF